MKVDRVLAELQSLPTLPHFDVTHAPYNRVIVGLGACKYDLCPKLLSLREGLVALYNHVSRQTADLGSVFRNNFFSRGSVDVACTPVVVIKRF